SDPSNAPIGPASLNHRIHRNVAHVVDAALKRTGALSFNAKAGTMVARAGQFTKHTGLSRRALTSTSRPRPHQCSNMIFPSPFASHTVDGAPVSRVETGAQR